MPLHAPMFQAGHLSLFCVNQDRKSTRLNSSHLVISYAVFCLKKKKNSTSYERNDSGNAIFCLPLSLLALPKACPFSCSLCKRVCRREVAHLSMETTLRSDELP